jgi:hypothetical protein
MGPLSQLYPDQAIAQKAQLVERRHLRFIWPGMAWVSPHQLAPDLGIETLPEARQIAGHLYRPLVRGQEMNQHGSSVGPNSRCFAHPKEVL